MIFISIFLVFFFFTLYVLYKFIQFNIFCCFLLCKLQNNIYFWNNIQCNFFVFQRPSFFFSFDTANFNLLQFLNNRENFYSSKNFSHTNLHENFILNQLINQLLIFQTKTKPNQTKNGEGGAAHENVNQEHQQQ